MKEILWTIAEVVAALVALLVVLGILCLVGMSLFFLPYLAYMALVLYLLIPRDWGMFGTCGAIVVGCIYLAFLFLFAIFWQPVFCLMSSLMPMTAVILMLRRKPLWMWGVVALIFLTIGVYYVFHNDIKGPMEFMICDRPIDVPAQWHHCYRFFWTGIVVETVTNIAGFVSVIFLSVLPLKKIVRKACERLEM